MIVLGDVGFDRIDRAVTELAVAGTNGSAALEDPGDSGVAVGAITLVGISNEIGAGMAARGAGWCAAQGGV